MLICEVNPLVTSLVTRLAGFLLFHVFFCVKKRPLGFYWKVREATYAFLNSRKELQVKLVKLMDCNFSSFSNLEPFFIPSGTVLFTVISLTCEMLIWMRF